MQRNENGRSQVFVSNINTNEEPELLIAANDIILALPDVVYPLLIEFAQLDPNDPNVLLLMVRYAGEGENENGRFLLAYNFETEAIEIRWTIDPEPEGSKAVYNLSPDHEWLLTHAFTGNENENSAYLFHDLDSGATITVPFHLDEPYHRLIFDWSQDGEWFAYSQNGMIQLFAPDEGRRHEIVADGLLCSNPVWTNRVQSGEE